MTLRIGTSGWSYDHGQPRILRATAPFVYVRLQAQGRDISAYVNNDGAGHAVRSARTLRAMLL